MSPSFNEKTILITGASTGLGKETALFLAKKGVKGITLFARGKDKLDLVAKEIEDMDTPTKVLVVAGDASKDEDNKRAVEETIKVFGGITGAFVNAGIYRGGTFLADTSDADINDLIDINVKGVIYALRHVLPAIAKTVGDVKTDPTGSVVVTSSCMGDAIVAPKSMGSSIYSASKAFVNSLIMTAATEVAPRIRVNGVMPGVVKTEIMPVDNDTYHAIGASLQPLWGRPGVPAEIASLVTYLISDEASFISGTNIKADGLWSLSGGSM